MASSNLENSEEKLMAHMRACAISIIWQRQRSAQRSSWRRQLVIWRCAAAAWHHGGISHGASIAKHKRRDIKYQHRAISTRLYSAWQKRRISIALLLLAAKRSNRGGNDDGVTIMKSGSIEKIGGKAMKYSRMKARSAGVAKNISSNNGGGVAASEKHQSSEIISSMQHQMKTSKQA